MDVLSWSRNHFEKWQACHSIGFAGWQRGFSVWSQSGHRPQRANLIPTALSNSWRTKTQLPATCFHTHMPPTLQHFYFLFHVFIISLTCALCLLTPPPLLSLYSPSLHVPFANVRPSWHLAGNKSYLWAIRMNGTLSVYIVLLLRKKSSQTCQKANVIGKRICEHDCPLSCFGLRLFTALVPLKGNLYAAHYTMIFHSAVYF